VRQQKIDAILDKYFDRLYSYVAFRVSPDRQAAEDITQEVFLAAVKGIGNYAGKGSPWTWLVAIARHKIADYFRAASPRTTLPDDAAEASVPMKDEQQERALLVSLALRRLPEHYARVLESKYIEGLAVAEIARRDGSTESSVESLLTRARQAFEQAFKMVEQTREE